MFVDFQLIPLVVYTLKKKKSSVLPSYLYFVVGTRWWARDGGFRCHTGVGQIKGKQTSQIWCIWLAVIERVAA